jgi:hypothetical protein
VLYLGRGTSYPLALEGALKLKEISYIHAEGYAAGELKHGPIALVDQDMPVIVIAPNDSVLEKTISNMQEVAARGGRLILIGDARLARDFANEAAATIVMRDAEMPKITDQRLGRASLTRGNVAGSHTPGNNTTETRLPGWGTWIRTKINGVRVSIEPVQRQHL